MFVKQKYNADCGVACVSMLIDVDYNTSATILGVEPENLVSLAYTDIASALTKNSYLIKDPFGVSSWEGIPDNSLVLIENEVSSSLPGHWVVWKNKKVYDPARGVFKLSRYNHNPSLYLQVAGGKEKQLNKHGECHD